MIIYGQKPNFLQRAMRLTANIIELPYVRQTYKSSNFVLSLGQESFRVFCDPTTKLLLQKKIKLIHLFFFFFCPHPKSNWGQLYDARQKRTARSFSTKSYLESFKDKRRCQGQRCQERTGYMVEGINNIISTFFPSATIRLRGKYNLTESAGKEFEYITNAS